MTDTFFLAVVPLLPAAASLLAALLAGGLSALAAASTLRPAAMAKFARIVWRQWRGIAVLSCVAAAIVVGTRWRTVEPTPPVVATEFRSAQWRTFRGDVSRTGRGDDGAGPLTGGVCWAGGRGYQFFSSAAIVGDSLVAVGSRHDSARFFCWDARTGRLLWSHSPARFRATFSSPVVAQGYLVCGEGLHHTPQSRLVAYQVDGRGLLAPAFEFATHSHVECTPTIDSHRVFFNAGDDGVYCLSLVADEAHRVVWHAAGKRYPDAETALAVHDERVFVGLGRGGRALCVLDATSGEEIARLRMPLPVFSPPAINGGRLYLGMGDADYVNAAVGSSGELRCLDLNTLETVWTLATPSPLLAAIVVSDGQVICGDVGGNLMIVGRCGQVLHRWRAAAQVLAAPAVTRETIYCVSCDGLLTALDRRLRPIWRVRLGAAGAFASSPVVFDGRIFVGTPHDGFVAVGPSPATATVQK